MSRVYDALPEESRTARVQLLVPSSSSSSSASSSAAGGAQQGAGMRAGRLAGCRRPPSGVVHLAGTGDQGFSRRLRLSFPLIKQARG